MFSFEISMSTRASWRGQQLLEVLMDSLEVWLPLVVKVITCGNCQKSSLPEVAKMNSEEEMRRQEGGRKNRKREHFHYSLQWPLGLIDLTPVL